MGIDHPNVRYVIHIQLPESLESYFQEAGRAGRNGDFAQAIILYSEYDKTLIKKQFIDSLAGPKDLKDLYRKLNNYFQISYGEGEFAEYSFSFTDFCKTYNLNTLLAYNGLNALDRLAILQLSKEFGRKSILRFLVSTEVLLSYFSKNMNASIVGKTILRLYGGVFEVPTQVNLELIASKTGQDVSEIISILQKMERDQLIELSLKITDASITFLVPREDDKTINVVAKEVETLNNKKKAQVKAVLTYVENDLVCKSVQLVQYFGETTAESCGICSVCAAKQSILGKKEMRLITEKILISLEESQMTSRELSESFTFAEYKILQVLQVLIDAEKIKINTKNQYYLL
jgi:ATP-dependent DNA helicase RecQ